MERPSSFTVQRLSGGKLRIRLPAEQLRSVQYDPKSMAGTEKPRHTEAPEKSKKSNKSGSSGAKAGKADVDPDTKGSSATTPGMTTPLGAGDRSTPAASGTPQQAVPKRKHVKKVRPPVATDGASPGPGSASTSAAGQPAAGTQTQSVATGTAGDPGPILPPNVGGLAALDRSGRPCRRWNLTPIRVQTVSSTTFRSRVWTGKA
ncbi:hypothetical protein PYCC9005_004560 [Savitreella phatthalungensis]